MATILKIEPYQHPGLVDSSTGKTCIVEKIVDVTDLCPEAKDERCLFLYTRAKRGRIIQMIRPYRGEKFMGMSIHFFIDEITSELSAAPRDDTFGSWSKNLGLTKTALKTLIEVYAPEA